MLILFTKQFLHMRANNFFQPYQKCLTFPLDSETNLRKFIINCSQLEIWSIYHLDYKQNEGVGRKFKVCTSNFIVSHCIGKLTFGTQLRQLLKAKVKLLLHFLDNWIKFLVIFFFANFLADTYSSSIFCYFWEGSSLLRKVGVALLCSIIQLSMFCPIP